MGAYATKDLEKNTGLSSEMFQQSKVAVIDDKGLI